jgi:MFS family permease
VEPNPHGVPLGLGTAGGYEAVGEESDEAPRRSRLGGVAGRVVRLGTRSRAPKPPPLLNDERFRVFWLARLATQTAQGALLYAFLLIVADRTGSATYNSLFVICSILPSIAFGLPAGIVVDALPRRPLLVALNAARFVFALPLALTEPSLLGIFAATLGIWTIHQFHAPSESAALTALVPRERFTSAQALSNLALTLAQLFGLVMLAPLLLRTVGPRALFAVCAALFFVAAGLAAMLPRLDEHVGARGRARRSLRATLLDGWRGVREDEITYGALVTDVMVGIGVSALVVIMPLYLKGVLDTAAENTVFVFAPAALGLVVGLRFAPWIGRFFGERRVATAGLLGFATCVGSLGFVEGLRGFLVEGLRLPLNQVADLARIPALVLVAMMISVPAGFCSSLVSVTARSLLLTNTPPSRRGQTIATAALLGNVGALVPTLLAGVATDLFGVEPIAVAIAVVLGVGAVAARTLARPGPLRAPAPST